jgi:hypothetical protein
MAVVLSLWVGTLNRVMCNIPVGQIMSLVIQAVNFIKSNALNSRIFNKLCIQMDAGSIQLLLQQRSDGCPKAKS